MENLSNIIFLPLIISFIITVIATPVSLHYLKKFKVLDDPKKHKHPAIIHKKAIPRGGGIPLFAGAFIAGLIFLPFDKVIIASFLAAFVSLVVGILDDKFDSFVFKIKYPAIRQKLGKNTNK